MRHTLRLDGMDSHVALTGPAQNRVVLIDQGAHPASLDWCAGSEASLELGGTTHRVHIALDGDTLHLWFDGETYAVSILEPLTRHARAAETEAGLEARAPMPGSVVSLPVAFGDTVAAGDVLVIIESMKLETALRAPAPGRVAAITCAPGGTFEKDAVLVRLEAIP